MPHAMLAMFPAALHWSGRHPSIERLIAYAGDAVGNHIATAQARRTLEQRGHGFIEQTLRPALA